MPRSDRYELTPLVRLAFAVSAAVLTWGLAWTVAEERAENRAEAHYRAKQYADRAPKDIERECAGRKAGAFSECIAEQVKTTREDQRAEYELGVQREVADWTFATMLVSFFTLVVTAIGVGFVKRTLDATLEAVEDTGRATDEMVRSNAIAERTAAAAIASHQDQVASSRPVLTMDTQVSSFLFPPFPGPWKDVEDVSTCAQPHFTIRNVGNQPCWIEAIWAGFYMAKAEGVEIEWPEVIRDAFLLARSGFLQVNESMYVGGSFWRFDQVTFDMLKPDSQTGYSVILYGMFQYRGLANHIFATRFAYHLNGHENKRFIAAPLPVRSHWQDGRVLKPKLAKEDSIAWIE